MSSITDPRLAMIGAAIDELAEASRAAGGTPGPGSTPGAPGTSGSMAERVARIWAMVADLDPGLAQRLPGYTDQHPQDRQGTSGPAEPATPTHD
jgi:hypothetical protein